MKQITKSGEAEIIVKKSRFIGEAHCVHTEEEAAALVAETRKRYYDARHVCYAYSIGDGVPRMKFSDDGEPKGTAGKPILDVVEGSEITDILVIVTRYFGGILLGTGGLVRAYSEAASEAVKAAETGTLVRCVKRNIDIAYPEFDKVRFMLESKGISDFETEYGSGIRIVAYIPEEIDSEVIRELTDITRGSAETEELLRESVIKKIV